VLTEGGRRVDSATAYDVVDKLRFTSVDAENIVDVFISLTADDT